MSSEGLVQGVYYSETSYAGPVRRLLVEITDVICALGLSFGVSLSLIILFPDAEERLGTTIVVTLPLVWFGYFVGLKASPVPTVGYRLFGVKLVNLQGEPPGLMTHLARLLFSALGPFNLVLDLLWVWSDSYRQTLRDKLAYTYVVRRDAVPTGRGPIVFAHYSVLGWHLLCREVRTGTVNHAR